MKRDAIEEWFDVPKNIEDYQGFVYIITCPLTKMYYVGKKNFWRIKKLPPLKGKKNKRHFKVESDWKKYWGSSESLKKDIEGLGEHCFERRIIKLCKDKWEMSYYELEEQMIRGVLFDEMSYNGIIHVRLKKRWGKVIIQ